MSKIFQNIAVLIDGDNTSPTLVEAILEEIVKYGNAYVKQVYGDWGRPELNGWKEKCLSYGLVAVQQFAYTAHKNATDMAMTIDAMDLLYSQKFDAFFLVSSDSDFTPLAIRIRKNGIKVYGIGKESAPVAFQKSCNRYITVESLVPKVVRDTSMIENPLSSQEKHKPWNQMALRNELPLLRFIRNAIKACNQASEYVAIEDIYNHIHKLNGEFNAQNYGYSKLSELIDAMGLFKVKRDNKTNSFKVACALSKTETKEAQQIIQKYNTHHQGGRLLNKSLIGKALKERGIHYKAAFGDHSLTDFLKKL